MVVPTLDHALRIDQNLDILASHVHFDRELGYKVTAVLGGQICEISKTFHDMKANIEKLETYLADSNAELHTLMLLAGPGGSQ